MKVKGGGRRKSWDAITEEDLANDNAPNDSYSSAPSLILLDVQQQQQQQPHDTQHPVLPLPRLEAQPQGDADDDVVDEEDDDNDDADENTERPKLDEGFYEIEAVRRKRVRKGQLQYLIKWRGWPETANTWEPLENLQSCSDVIDAFEESLRLGKHRKRKRKHGTPHTQPKKRQQRSPIATYNGTGVETVDVDKPQPSEALDNLSLTHLPAIPQSKNSYEEEHNKDANNIEVPKKANVENGCVNVSQQIGERRDEIEYDPKLSELKVTTSTNNVDKLAIHFQEAKALEGKGPIEGPKVDCVEPVQSNRSIGAKRRKSGSVKRFKQEPHLCELIAQNATSRTSIVPGGRVELLGVENPDVTGENSSCKNKIDESKNALRITKIIKPIGYSASVTNNVQDVSVTFMAMRSDGREVMVDNKFLKANNPLLLINFYEQHLRYSPTL
ncbi:hypothetical protein FNV43_RR12751 [Rhamnella rubrinervis]|uniref:Chromo domain-containing protein n=1 Tax=Rhamnella rubrinervis TaxID=2594499 RepID=A0A8K0H8F9_9ROSA|nr:hypothetical protein FNV43_RR12751 [Rhamnella rubrinervis]